MADKLLPCPFCGCSITSSDMSGDGTGHPRYTIKCSDCPGRMEFFSSTKEQAIAAWNRRATSSAVPQPSAKALTFADGIEAGARWVDKRREDHDSEFGALDPDTGAFEFRSASQEEYSAELYEVAEGIRAILAAEQPSEDKREDTAAARDVLAERRRQVEAEGRTPEGDDEHDEGQLSLAAAGYAESASDQIQCVAKELDDSTLEDDGCLSTTFPYGWKFKAAPPRRMLVKAGALILAEIERLDRAAMSASKEGA